MNVSTLPRFALRLHVASGSVFLAIVVGMFVAPGAVALAFPWPIGFEVQVTSYTVQGVGFLSTAVLLRRRQGWFVVGTANGIFVALYGAAEYAAGALYGVGDTAFGAAVIAMLMLVRRSYRQSSPGPPSLGPRP